MLARCRQVNSISRAYKSVFRRANALCAVKLKVSSGLFALVSPRSTAVVMVISRSEDKYSSMAISCYLVIVVQKDTFCWRLYSQCISISPATAIFYWNYGIWGTLLLIKYIRMNVEMASEKLTR